MSNRRITTARPTAAQVHEASKAAAAAWQRFTWTDNAHEAADLAAYQAAASAGRAINRAYSSR